MKNIVIFASGAGSNAAAIIRHFNDGSLARVNAIFCNNPKAGVLGIAEEAGISAEVFSREELRSGKVLEKLQDYQPDLIVLAGFLWMMPHDIINAYNGKIINIHPALLPKFGGKGMYGMNVHKAVVDQGETESGITIHYVDEHYDSGDIIAQFKVPVGPDDTCDTVSAKVRQLEHKHFPSVIEKLLS